MGPTLSGFSSSLPLPKLSPPPAGIAPIVTIFLDPLHSSSPRSDGAASCCCSLDAASCGALGFPFSWKRPVCDEQRHGILPCWILKWPHLGIGTGAQPISLLPEPHALLCSLWSLVLCAGIKVPRMGCQTDVSWLNHPGFWRQWKIAKGVVSAPGTTDNEGFMSKGKDR